MGFEKVRDDASNIFVRRGNKYRRAGTWDEKRWQGRAPFTEYRGAAEGAVTAAESFFQSAATTRANKDLSDAGQRKEIRARGLDAISEIRRHAKRTSQVRGIVRREMTELTPFKPYQPGDAVSVLIDLEWSRMLRSANEADRSRMLSQLASGSHPGLAAAVLRLPQEFTGVSANLIDVARRTVTEKMFPDDIEKRRQINEAGDTTQAALDAALQEVADEAGIAPPELREILGADAELFGILPPSDAESVDDRDAAQKALDRLDEERLSAELGQQLKPSEALFAGADLSKQRGTT